MWTLTQHICAIAGKRCAPVGKLEKEVRRVAKKDEKRKKLEAQQGPLPKRDQYGTFLVREKSVSYASKAGAEPEQADRAEMETFWELMQFVYVIMLNVQLIYIIYAVFKNEMRKVQCST